MIKVYDKLSSSYRTGNVKKYNNSTKTWQLQNVKASVNGTWKKINDKNNPWIPNISDVNKEFKYDWGYIILSKQSNSAKLLELYTRFYNALKYANKYSKYKYRDFSTGEIKTASCNLNIRATISGGLYDVLDVYVRDINCSRDDVYKVRGSICSDHPELLARYKALNLNTNTDSNLLFTTMDSLIYVNHVYLPRHTKEEHDKHFKAFDVYFKNFCKKLQDVYGIKYFEGTYSENNKRYSRSQKLQIAKIIHDYIILHCHYGDIDTKTGSQELWSLLMGEDKAAPVCAAYAKAFRYFCWKFGITCYTVNGACYSVNKGSDGTYSRTCTGYHSWNMVTYEPYTLLDSETTNENIWQEVDLTWDDNTSKRSSFISWSHFNISSDRMYGKYGQPDKPANRELTLYETGSLSGVWEVIDYPIKNCKNESFRYNGSEKYYGFENI